jgi:hypothetical protein
MEKVSDQSTSGCIPAIGLAFCLSWKRTRATGRDKMGLTHQEAAIPNGAADPACQSAIRRQIGILACLDSQNFAPAFQEHTA